MGTLPVMYGRIISIMQDLRRPPAALGEGGRPAFVCVLLATAAIDDYRVAANRA